MKVRCSRRIISGLLLIWLGLLQFPLPFALRASGTAASDKDLSTPFPCMNRPCGCRSAEECWTSCCCTTKAERIAFVLDHGLEMPAALADAEESPAPARTCCSAGSEPACCTSRGDEADKPYCERPKKPVRKGLVLLSSALKCKGLTSMLMQFGGAVVPTAPCTPDLVPVAHRLLALTDDLRTGVTLSPPAPPPRISG
ncbi:hypothetical protein Pan44_15200 [Caulifigura coniformis]|uniref:Uncharacterized protein n=1 Tax=Caulifigura coniformis TaxID=2527983 RepID=A0A517SBK7_9PLAN|nr:hypothetical protein [Caulifigura coniformis]QDT53498.1 hypothetical protein Pan44_15200 [Caulifigura coniformis]